MPKATFFTHITAHTQRGASWIGLLCALWLLTACAMPAGETGALAESTQPSSRGASAAATPVETAPIGTASSDTESSDTASSDTESQDVIFTRHREGGIAGFCDDVTVYASGAYQVESCRGNADEEPASAQLTNEQIDMVNAWTSTLQSFEYSQRDPAMADAMTISLVFNGAGDQVATEEQQLEMVALANELFVQVQP